MYRLKRYSLSVIFIAFVQICFAQTNWAIDSLTALNERIQAAKSTNNNKLALENYFGSTFQGNSTWTFQEGFQKVTDFMQEGIDFALSVNEYDYAAIGHTRMAVILRKRNQVDKAIENAELAISNAEKTESDSVKAIAYTELGECYQKKAEPVKASKSFTTALELALKGEIHSLESNTSRRLANLYYLAGDTEEAKRQTYKSVAIDREFGLGEGLIEDYTQLGRVTDNARYLDTVFTLADSLGLQNKIFKAKSRLLEIYAFVYKDSKKALSFINSNKDIKEDILGKGIANYNWYIGQIFRYGNLPDSALYYLKLAEPSLINDLGISFGKYIYLDIAVCYQLKDDSKNAIYYYEKMLEHTNKADDPVNVALVSDSLSKLYNLTGDFKKAYQYKLIATDIGNSLAAKTKEKELVLLDLDREKKKHEEERRQAEEYLHKKHNLQYLGITIGICVLFLCFLLLGMFPVSKLVIKIFGYIYFICVFEFIVLLIEHSVLHPITHGDPLKLWSLKIILIALLVPIQQYLEHGLIHFLQSRKLHMARTKFLAEKWVKKKPVPEPETDPEIEPGVL